jgi:hypothetical protein
MGMHKRVEWIWPPLTDTASAQKASKQGLLACTWCAGATLFLVVLSILGVRLFDFDMWALIDALLFIVIGWGIYKMNRFAAIAGLALYIIERAFMWFEYGPKNPVIALIISFMFVNSIRGIFAYHRHRKGQGSTTVV